MTSKKALIYKLLLDDALFEKTPSLITMTSRDDKNFDGNLLNKGVSVKAKWPSGSTVFVSGTQPVDYLLCGPRHDAVSHSARRVIETTVGYGVEFLPVSVVNENT